MARIPGEDRLLDRRLLTRRRVLAGGAVGTGAAVLAACVGDPDPYDGFRSDEIGAFRVDRVPREDPDSSIWERARPTRVVMDAQVLVLPFRTAPSVPAINVRALHDGETIAFRLDWDDEAADDLTVMTDGFRDACAVLLAEPDGDAGLRLMGSVAKAATLLHWKADWQRDVDAGVQGMDAAFPNLSIDTYPPLRGVAPGDVEPASYVEAGATEWLPGLHVGNSLSMAERATCVEKILAKGPGSSGPAPTQDCVGRGARRSSGWSVVLAKPLAGSDVGEFAMSPRGRYTCAFAIWSGSTDDSGGRKTPSKTVFSLVLEP